jgi:hypothetical protein
LRRGAPLPLLVTILLCRALVPTAAADEETSIQAANELEADYDTALEETVLDDRLDASLSRGPFTLGATFLSHSPSDAGRLDPHDYGEQVQGVRKRWLEASSGDFTARIGDVYATFGRGLALQIFEDRTVDFDNVLDGFYGRAVYGPATLEVIGGSNSLGEVFHVVKGGQLLLDLPTGAALGLEGVWSDSTATGALARPGGDRLAGAHLSGSIGSHADLYGEYVIHQRKNFREGASDPAQGHAGYANLSLYLGPIQILGEFRDLLRYQLQYINPPTAFRSHTSTLLNRASHIANLRFDDERGGMVETYLTLDDATRIDASFSRTEARHAHFPARETYGELERWFGDAECVIRAGETEETVREGLDDVFFERITYSATVLYPFSDTFSLEVTGETQGAQESNQSTQTYRFAEKYRDNLVTATFSKAPNMSWGLTYEWTDDHRQSKDHWIWAEWNIQIGNRHQLGLGGGSFRGGQLCSGGICKLVDPFEGGRIELLTTF